MIMSVKGEIKEGAGFVKGELYEHDKSPESQRKAQEGAGRPGPAQRRQGRGRQSTEDNEAG